MHRFDNISLHFRIFHLKNTVIKPNFKVFIRAADILKKASSPLLAVIYFSKEEISLGAFSDIHFPSLV